ncbi:hypothetical protein K435DRAFT_799218 [Dendrothele bispora CBS 962.96]|uniref:Uncharacterized protein n=1 Tax=Dendrothele bispora (strain CBS 962.96) TaxID=1314807 RepID=A0A4V4HF89_DENBC|nr:hypothetical protein K435DRAFT_799218 [Dendrothele bispora CBS 962.96]
MSNLLDAHDEQGSTPSVDPVLTCNDGTFNPGLSALGRPQDPRNRANTPNINPIHRGEVEASNIIPLHFPDYLVPFSHYRYEDVVGCPPGAVRDYARFFKAPTEHATDRSGGTPQVLLAVSRFEDRIIVDTTTHSDAQVSLTINPKTDVPLEGSQSRSNGTGYKFYRAFVRAFFYTSAFVLVLVLPDMYDAATYWFQQQQQTDEVVLVGTGMQQRTASSELVLIIMRSALFYLIIALSGLVV